MLKKNDIVKCIVTGYKEYGIFVSVNNEYSGLIHISEISEAFVRNVGDYVEIGEIIYAKIMDIDETNKHLKLTIKGMNYKIDGNSIKEIDKNGFMPLKNNLNIWINEKIKDIRNFKQ